MQDVGRGPKARTNLSVRQVDGETVVLDRGSLKVHQLNATASHVWELCTGERTEAEIADDLAEAFDIDPVQAGKDVTTLIVQFRELGLLAQE